MEIVTFIQQEHIKLMKSDIIDILNVINVSNKHYSLELESSMTIFNIYRNKNFLLSIKTAY